MSDIVYNPLSQVTQLKTGAANPDMETYQYDALTGLLTGQQVYKANNSANVLLNLSYDYQKGNSNGSLNGKTGQLTKITDNLNQNKNRVFEFDTLGRLKTAKAGLLAGGVQTAGTPTVTANWTQTYGYDRYGNRESVGATGQTQNGQNVPTDGLPSQSYNTASNRINTTGYEYDLAGNLSRGQSPDGVWQRYLYDVAGRLVQVKRESDNWIQQANGYGSSRQRAYSWSYAAADLTWYVWGGSSVIAEYAATGWQGVFSWTKSYIYAGSRLLSTFTKNGGGEKLEFHHPDRLGTRLITDNNSNTFFEQNTLPFGTELAGESSSGTNPTNQRFTSYDRSTVANLDYAVNRSYSSGQGRFTSVDPIGMSSTSLGSPQSLNLYAYVENNPIDFSDPSGLLKGLTGTPINIGVAGTVNISSGEIGGGLETWNWGLMSSFIDTRLFNEMPEFSGGGTWEVNISADSDPVRPTPTEVVVDKLAGILNDLKNACTMILQKSGLLNQLNSKLSNTTILSAKDNPSVLASNYFGGTKKNETLPNFLLRRFNGQGYSEGANLFTGFSTSNKTAILSYEGAYTFLPKIGDSAADAKTKEYFALHEFTHHATGLSDAKIVELFNGKGAGINVPKGGSASEALSNYFNGGCK